MDNKKKPIIKIAYWNANGFRDKKCETLDFLIKNKIDILLLGETKFNQNSNIKLQGFNCLHKNRNADGTGGGVAIYT